MNSKSEQDRFRAFSAGSKPAGNPHPDGLAELRRRHVSTEGLRSKSWDEFSGVEAERIDLVITVCNAAANETCPVFHGTDIRVNWSVADPAGIADADERKRTFSDVFNVFRSRIDRLVHLPSEALKDRRAIQAIADDGRASFNAGVR